MTKRKELERKNRKVFWITMMFVLPFAATIDALIATTMTRGLECFSCDFKITWTQFLVICLWEGFLIWQGYKLGRRSVLEEIGEKK